MIRLALSLVVAATILALLQLNPGSPAAWAVGSAPGFAVENLAKPLTAGEMKKIELHLRRTLGTNEIRLVPQPPEAEVFVGERFIGVVYPEEQNGQRAFYFEMAIFASDLEQNEPASSKR